MKRIYLDFGINNGIHRVKRFANLCERITDRYGDTLYIGFDLWMVWFCVTIWLSGFDHS